MKRASVSAVLVFVAVLAVTAVIVVAVGLGTDGATAIEVGDQKMSRSELNDELRQWADFEESGARATDGAVTGRAGATIATQVVYEMLANQYLDRTGEEVTAEDRSGIRASVADAQGFQDLPRWFRDRYVERQATFAALTRVVGADDQATEELRVLRREARRTDVSVDPAYGRFAPVALRVEPYPTPFTPAQG